MAVLLLSCVSVPALAYGEAGWLAKDHAVSLAEHLQRWLWRCWGWPALADAQHPEGTRPTIWDRTHKPSETVGSLPVPSLNLCWWCTVHAVCSTFPPIFRRLCELRELFGVDKIRWKKVKALLDRKMVKYDYQASSFHNDRAWGGVLDLVAGGQSYFSTVKWSQVVSCHVLILPSGSCLSFLHITSSFPLLQVSVDTADHTSLTKENCCSRDKKVWACLTLPWHGFDKSKFIGIITFATGFSLLEISLAAASIQR